MTTRSIGRKYQSGVAVTAVRECKRWIVQAGSNDDVHFRGIVGSRSRAQHLVSAPASSGRKEADLTARGSLIFLTLGLAVAWMACGDDDADHHDAGPVDAAGRGGRGGTGGSTGDAGSSCAEAEHKELADWCKDAAKGCELSFEERRARVCSELRCSRPTCGVSESANSCGGKSVVYFRASDVSSARYDYDRDGELVGVSNTSSQPTGCRVLSDVYGEDCQWLEGEAVDCSEYPADGGIEDASM